MPASKLILSVGLTVMLASLAGAAVRKCFAPPPEESARKELVKLQSMRYREWLPPEQ